MTKGSVEAVYTLAFHLLSDGEEGARSKGGDRPMNEFVEAIFGSASDFGGGLTDGEVGIEISRGSGMDNGSAVAVDETSYRPDRRGRLGRKQDIR